MVCKAHKMAALVDDLGVLRQEMDIKKLLKQGFKFALVGGINTLIDMGVFSLLMLVPFFARYYILANVVSYGCGVANSLFMNKRFTFGDKGRMGMARVALFILINLLSWGVSSLLLSWGVETLGLSRFLSKAIAIGGSLGVNFTLNKLLVFRN